MIDQIFFEQGAKNLLEGVTDFECKIQTIKFKIADLINAKNLNVLMGAGTSSGAIPAMKRMLELLDGKITDKSYVKLWKKLKKNNANLENILGILYSGRFYLEGLNSPRPDINSLIKQIENFIFNEINVNVHSKKDTLELYKTFYYKLAFRNKNQSRLNIFTTNNDLFNETAISELNLNYNNGFSSGVNSTFNPARFTYTFSKKIDTALEKYEPIAEMVYLYKLHGSINWVEEDTDSFFKIKEIKINTRKVPANNVLIYPTPLKQNKSLGSPFADLIREFHDKLLISQNVLIIIGYSFSDEHINNVIYSALAANANLSILIFGDYKENNILSKINDPRIYKVYGETEQKKIHYFDYIVNKLLPDFEINPEKTLMEQFIESLQKEKIKSK